MDKKIVELLKNYLDENDLEMEEVDIGEKTIDDIKSSLVDFADYFLRFFNSFYKIFKNCKDEQITIFIENNKKQFNGVLRLFTTYKEYPIEQGMWDVRQDLINYLEENYFEINDFFDICLEINEE